MKELFLKKGWAGKTISRQETVERLNPILRRHNALLLSHGDATGIISESDANRQYERYLNMMRADSGKLSESILSCGGAPELGAGAGNPTSTSTSSSDDRISSLIDDEQQFLSVIDDELKANHQMRTRAVLGAVQKNTRERLSFLKSIRTS